MAVVDLNTFCTKEELEKIRYVCRLFNAQKVWVVPNENKEKTDQKL